MLAAPHYLGYDVLLTLFCVYSFDTFFTIYDNILSPSPQIGTDIGFIAVIWFGSFPTPFLFPSLTYIYLIREGVGRRMVLQKKIF